MAIEMGISKGTSSGTTQSPSMTRLLEIQNEKEQDSRQKDNGDDDDDDLLKLHDAVCEEDLDEIRDLTEEDDGKLVFHQDDDKNTPLHTICLRGLNFFDSLQQTVLLTLGLC